MTPHARFVHIHNSHRRLARADSEIALLRRRSRRGYDRAGAWVSGVVAAAALFLPHQDAARGGPYVFGLDNRPQAPISIDPPGIGNGPEDPFGLVAAPVRIGPSPSLNTLFVPLGRTMSDADILTPGATAPLINTMRPLNTNYVDAISSNRAPINGRQVRLAFSVDRASVGVVSSAVHNQFLLNQHPGDVFFSARDFPAPSQYLGVTTGFGWFGNLSSTGPGSSNLLLLNQSELKLTAGMGPGNFVNESTLAPPIVPGSHDSVDAFDIVLEDTTGDFISDKHVYFSVNPDQPALNPASYVSAADIYRTSPGSQLPTLFATANSMGLMPFDDIDALDVFDRGTIGVLDSGDYALFSLSPGSQSLHVYPGLTAAHVFFTDFRQSFATFAKDADLGLSGTVDPAELGGGGAGIGIAAELGGADNMSGMSFYPLGDMDWNGSLDLNDVDDFVQGLTRPTEYDNNLDHLGSAPMVGDFSAPLDGLDFDDVAPFRAAIQAAVNPASGTSVPEPHSATLAIFVVLVLTSFRQSMR